jgi:ribosomal protein L29
MSVDRSRMELHRRLSEVIGDEGADTLMAHLPPVTWQDVATKQDVGSLGSNLRAEMADLRTELKTEMADLRTDLKTEMADLRTDLTGLRGELATSGTRLEARIDQAITQQTWRLATFVGAWGALLVTVVGLIR